MIYGGDRLMPARHDWDFYRTSPETVDLALSLCDVNPSHILDLGAGEGVWGERVRVLWPSAHITGIEIRSVDPHPTYDRWIEAPFPLAANECRGPYDLVIGNPPYREAEEFVRGGLALLRDGGLLIFLLRLAFLEGQARRDGIFESYPPAQVGVCSKRPSFYGNGKTNATAFAVFVWRAGWHGEPILSWL